MAVALPDDGTVSSAGGTVILDGSGSDGGPWGEYVTYSWALTNPSSGVTVTFNDAGSATPVVTIPALPANTELTFTLTVAGRSGSDGVTRGTDAARVSVPATNVAPSFTSAATFAYVDAGQTTDSELRAWGAAHALLWAALRARTFAVHVVAVGTGAEAADRAAPVLKRWTQDGDGTGTADPTGQSQADPEVRQEIASLRAAITAGNRSLLSAWGGFKTAADRLMALRQLPEGRPTTTTARGAIDRFKIWSTVRLTTPEITL